MKALLFDFDGLLMDTETPEVEIWQQIYQQHGVEFPLHTWIKKVVGSTDDNFNPALHLAELTGLPLDPVEIRNEARRKRLDIQSRLEALPGARANAGGCQAPGIAPGDRLQLAALVGGWLPGAVANPGLL